MLFNCDVLVNEKGNLIIEVPTGVDNSMNQEELHNHLQDLLNTPLAFSKEYTLRDGSVNKYVYLSNIQEKNGRYDTISVNGVNFKVKLDVVLTSKEVENHKPIKEEINKYKQLLEQGIIDQVAYDAIMGALKK